MKIARKTFLILYFRNIAMAILQIIDIDGMFGCYYYYICDRSINFSQSLYHSSVYGSLLSDLLHLNSNQLILDAKFITKNSMQL